MENTNSGVDLPSSPFWKLLGELDLTSYANDDPTVGTWLEVILKSLDLHTEFLDQVMNSAQEAVTRAIHAETIQFKQVHLFVYAPPDHTSNTDNWGFFRIEKTENARDLVYHNYVIEFFLYLDG